MFAIIAHDRKKGLMRDFMARHFDFFMREKLIATSGTASAIISFAQQVKSDTERALGTTLELLPTIIDAGHGPEGGDIMIGARIIEGKVQAVFFFRDPLSAHPHEHDVSALLRICDVHNVPVATNVASADLLVKSLRNAHS